MWWGKHYDAFISYSHKDAAVVKPLVELLSLNDRQVFWDQQLSPGDRWDEALRRSVRQSHIFVLFWCCDTGYSDYIAQEIALALRLKKKIVPVKLCNAALPQPLGAWQWIDLQKRVEHQCADLDHDIAPPLGTPVVMARRAYAPPKWAFALATLVLMVSGVFFLTFDRSLPPARGNSDLPSIGQTTSPAHPPLARIPTGAVRLPHGFAAVTPPARGNPGSITELDKQGRVLKQYSIAGSVPSPPRPEVTPKPLPWWYVNRAVLVAGAAFAAAVTFFIWIVWTAHRRTATTLDITRKYLERLANPAT